MVKKKVLSGERRERIKMIEPGIEISIKRQCELLGINRLRVYYDKVMRPDRYEKIKVEIKRIWEGMPSRGARFIVRELFEIGYRIGRKKAGELMRLLGLSALFVRKNLTKRAKGHKKYPYLLRDIKIERVNQVWSTDITYIKLASGFAYLTAVIDWYSRKVLSWRLSNTLDNSFCKDAVKEALCIYGQPEVFNTDQGSQYTANDFTKILEDKKIKISMDGKGRAVDNIFIERLWRTVKYEHAYIWRFDTIKELREGLKDYFDFYNNKREHQSLGYKTPSEVYGGITNVQTA